MLDLDAPEGIAANAGIPREFPRINSYVLISSEAGFIVGQVEWIAIERSPFPKRKGFHDYGLVDLPFPLRKMRVNPLGVLKAKNNSYYFERGIHSFPSIGEPVLIPTDIQLRSIIESGQNRHVKIGTSPLAANADVCIDPDRLFGRHLAVLGNTGSGKSCSVAGLIQWSLEAVQKEKTNSRFIILDPNGEYTKVFGDSARIFQVDSATNPLQVPLWFWNSAEWSSFTQASAKAQIPLLKKALRFMRNEQFNIENSTNIQIKNFLGTILLSLKHEQSTGSPWGSFPKPKHFFVKICKWLESLNQFYSKLADEEKEKLKSLMNLLETYKSNRNSEYPEYEATHEEIDNIINQIRECFNVFGGDEKNLLPKNEDTPIKFKGEDFINIFDLLAQETNNDQYVEFLLARIRTMIADTRMNTIIGDEINLDLSDWLSKYIGTDTTGDENSCITVIDLSLVPTEITHIVTAVIARIVFESLQRYRKINGKSLPTVLVMEEAHTFIKRYKEDTENQSASSVCCQIFEKIAREGRKFGLGLLLSSQRPSELSSTVLSQCNSFLLHRISNDKDQDLVNRLIPDNFRGLLRELPTLPSQQAILLGWASELPVMVKMNDIPKEKQPQSADPDFWDVWTGTQKREVNWKAIADDWQQKSTEKNDS
ncbi:TPA: ATP-binding protein [Legionella pneumophila]